MKSARAWAVAMAQGVNEKDPTFSRARPLSTKRGQEHFGVYEGDDVSAGRRMPGPLPFTPVSVSGSATQKTIRTCYWVKGWAREQNGKPQSAKSIIGASYQMIKSPAGVWQVNALYSDPGVRCKGVRVRGVRF